MEKWIFTFFLQNSPLSFLLAVASVSMATGASFIFNSEVENLKYF